MKPNFKAANLLTHLTVARFAHLSPPSQIQACSSSRHFASVCLSTRPSRHLHKSSLLLSVPRRLYFDESDSNSEKNEAERKVFRPDQPLYYSDGKYSVFLANNRHIVKFFIGINGLTACYTGFKAISKLLMFKPIGLVFWGVLCCLSSFGTRNGLTYASRYIREVNLIQNGGRVEIVNILNGRKVVRPHQIRKPNETQLLQFKIVSLPDDLYPVIVRDSLFMLQRRGRIQHEQVFRAVINGFQIDQEQLKSKEDEDIIDI